MPRASEIKRGSVIEHEGQVYAVKDLSKSAPTARGSGTVIRFRLNHVVSKLKLDISVSGDDMIKEADYQRRPASYLYQDGDSYVFMDAEDYGQHSFNSDELDGIAEYLTDGIEGLMLVNVDGNPVSVELPTMVVLEIIETPPPMKAASATSRTKTAKCSTGLEIQVPEYIASGERVKINTTTGEFSGRAG
jgi:elongation factor P